MNAEDPEMWAEIQKGPQLKKPRTPKQMEAFEKCKQVKQTKAEERKKASSVEARPASTPAEPSTTKPEISENPSSQDPVSKSIGGGEESRQKVKPSAAVSHASESDDSVSDKKRSSRSGKRDSKPNVIVVKIPADKKRKSRKRYVSSSSDSDSDDEDEDDSEESVTSRDIRRYYKSHVRRHKASSSSSSSYKPPLMPPPPLPSAPVKPRNMHPFKFV